MNFNKKPSFPKKNSTKRVFVSLFLIALITSGAIALSTVYKDKDGMFALVVSKVLVNFTNEDRKVQNLSELKVNPLLEKAAELKAKDMIEKGYFAHQSPEGLSPWYWLDKVGYDFSYAGENLAINFTESADVNNAWLNSPKHKENIMNGNFTEIGIAAVDGMYEGKMTTFVVQFFGKPAKKSNIGVVTEIGSTPKTNPVISRKATKVSTTTSSDVLGASDQKILYLGGANDDLLSDKNIKKSFWRYFIPVWF